MRRTRAGVGSSQQARRDGQGNSQVEKTAEQGVAERLFRVYVGGLPISVDTAKLNLIFKRFDNIGGQSQVVRCRVSGKSRRFGFITFKTYADAKKAIDEMDQVVVFGESTVNGSRLRVNWATNEIIPKSKDQKFNEVFHSTFDGNTLLYLGNCCGDIRKGDYKDLLTAAFSKYGQVVNVVVGYRKFAFVTMDCQENATWAILGMNNKYLHGYSDGVGRLRVKWGKQQLGHGSGTGFTRFKRNNHDFAKVGAPQSAVRYAHTNTAILNNYGLEGFDSFGQMIVPLEDLYVATGGLHWLWVLWV